MKTTTLLLLVLLLTLPASAQVYKWTDSQGKTHYGDSPPDDAKKQQLKIPTYEGPAQVVDWASILRKKTAAPPPAMGSVTMYSTEWCGVCKRARSYFTTQGIRFTEIDIEKSEAGMREFKEYGGKGVPLILAGGKVMRGFSPAAFEAMRKPAK